MSQPDYEYPRADYKSCLGWWVMQEGPNEFVLIAAHGDELGRFGTLEAAIDYMNKEFL